MGQQVGDEGRGRFRTAEWPWQEQQAQWEPRDWASGEGTGRTSSMECTRKRIPVTGMQDGAPILLSPSGLEPLDRGKKKVVACPPFEDFILESFLPLSVLELPFLSV